ncbi:MAG: YbaB/EbfC family nucleoid-associated protein [Phycisphaerales bacterium]
MFDQMKSLGALAGLMKNKERIREVGERVKRNLEEARLCGQAGGGAVRVIVSGRMRVHEVIVDPAAAGALADPASRDQVQELIAEAMNDAVQRAERMVKEEAQKAADELGLGDSPELARLFGGT